MNRRDFGKLRSTGSPYGGQPTPLRVETGSTDIIAILLDSRKDEWSRIAVVSIPSLDFNERLRQTTGFNDHDQYGDNVDKNMGQRQFQPVQWFE